MTRFIQMGRFRSLWAVEMPPNLTNHSFVLLPEKQIFLFSLETKIKNVIKSAMLPLLKQRLRLRGNGCLASSRLRLRLVDSCHSITSTSPSSGFRTSDSTVIFRMRSLIHSSTFSCGQTARQLPYCFITFSSNTYYVGRIVPSQVDRVPVNKREA